MGGNPESIKCDKYLVKMVYFRQRQWLIWLVLWDEMPAKEDDETAEIRDSGGVASDRLRLAAFADRALPVQ